MPVKKETVTFFQCPNWSGGWYPLTKMYITELKYKTEARKSATNVSLKNNAKSASCFTQQQQQPKAHSGSSGKARPDLPRLMNHLLAQYFAQEENLRTFLEDIEDVRKGRLKVLFDKK